MRITVLCGGTSTERSVSIVSGVQVAKALRSRGHGVCLIDVFCGDQRIRDINEAFDNQEEPEETAAYIHDFDPNIGTMHSMRLKNRSGFFGPYVIEVCRASDVVFMALHGTNGEDGRIQAVFDLMGIRYTGCGYLGSAMAMDKEISKEIFRRNGVPTPSGIVVHKGKQIEPGGQNGVGFPCVVKPACGGSSVGVSIAHNEEEYQIALEEAFSYEDVLIVESYISGREFSVGVVAGEAYPVIEIAPKNGFYNYSNKYSAGSTVETCPADLDAETTARMQDYALQAYRALNLNGYGRMDVMMNKMGDIFILEANTLPGMTPTSLLPQEAAALGMDFADLCERLIEVSGSRTDKEA